MPRSRRLNVVAVTPMYPPRSRVGAWLSTHECLRHLAKRNHRVRVVTYMAEDTYTLDGVEVLGRTVTPSVLDDADLVVSHLGDNGNAALEAAARGIPSVRMAHGLHDENAARLTDSPTSLVVFNSQTLADATPHTCPSIVVRPPADLDEYRTTPGDRVTLINLTKAKGALLFYELAKSMPWVQFLGVRGGYGLQESNKSKNLLVIDPTENPRDDIYAKTRILLIPSEVETWGRVGLEAMASGIPVIAHPTPGLRESLGDAAFFVDRNNIDGWRQTIDHLYRFPNWDAASAAAQIHADRFDPTPDLARFEKAMLTAARQTVAA